MESCVSLEDSSDFRERASMYRLSIGMKTTPWEYKKTKTRARHRRFPVTPTLLKPQCGEWGAGEIEAKNRYFPQIVYLMCPDLTILRFPFYYIMCPGAAWLSHPMKSKGPFKQTGHRLDLFR